MTANRSYFDNTEDFKQLIWAGLHAFGYGLKSYGNVFYPMIGKRPLGLEIYYDDQMDETEKIFIKTCTQPYSGQARYMKAGIWKEEKDTLFYGVGGFEKLYVFRKRQLQFIHLLMMKPCYGMKGVEFQARPPSHGFAITFEKAEERAELVIQFEYTLFKRLRSFGNLIDFLISNMSDELPG